MSTEDVTAEIAAVLAEHVLNQFDPACSCGWNWDPREVVLPSYVDFDPDRYRLPDAVRPAQHRAHLADALADLLAARDRRRRAEAWDEGYQQAESEAPFLYGSRPPNPYAEEAK